MSKTPDIIKGIFEKEEVEKEDQEEITVAGVWRCAYCGSGTELIIHPYFPNMPDYCNNLKCKERIPNSRFIFLRWKILK